MKQTSLLTQARTCSVSLTALVLVAAACSVGEDQPTSGPSPTSDEAGGGPASVVDGSASTATNSSSRDGGSVPSGGDAAIDAGDDADAPLYRDPLVQPFASDSIWNTSIGSAAKYVPAHISVTDDAVFPDPDIIVLTPSAPSTPIYRSKADWSTTKSRCPYENLPFIYDVPIPSDYVYGDPLPNTPNASLAALLADGRTIRQTQPFARCTAGAPATSDWAPADVDIYGPGITGAHGGTGLSAIGGTLRLGELRPGVPPPRHAIKLSVWGKENYYVNYNGTGKCYRWPAQSCDSNGGGTVPSLVEGALLALPANISIASLHLTTQPAQALAWTLQNYGAYLIDNVGWSVVNLSVETGPAGDFQEQFKADWGFPLDPGGTTSAFAKDMTTIWAALAVVDDNGPSSIGGAGTRLQPPALPLRPPTHSPIAIRP